MRNAISLDGTLSAKERRPRQLFLVLMSLIAVSLAGNLMYFAPSMHHAVVQNAASGIMAIGASFCVVWILLKFPLSTGLVVSILYTGAACLFLLDLSGRSFFRPTWPLLVLVIDFLLVMRVNERYTVALVVAVIMWLVLMIFEESFRFGLLDAPGLIPQEGKNGRREFYLQLTSCDALPCATDFSVGSLFVTILVFVLDFIATRGFAREVLAEQAAMERTIAAVQEIASLLAGYDVEGVARMLSSDATCLPEEMHNMLWQMEQNLRRYRPYLPAALFEEEGCDVAVSGAPPPGLHSQECTIVFTDIRLSTTIWECEPDGMHVALRVHNTVVRDVIRQFSGYEVKTIGDAFMVAFDCAANAACFSLHMHERLLAADWPVSLMDVPVCAQQGSLWGGLTIRIGMNSGPVTTEKSTLTGRTDYFGHTVNQASRLESTCKPGAVAMPAALWEKLQGDLQCDGVSECGTIELKGIADAVAVCWVWPTSLSGRRLQPLNENTTYSPVGSMVSREVSSCMSLATVTNHVHYLRQTLGTVGVIELTTGADAVANMNAGVAMLSVALDQSHGTLMTVLGNRLCVGWNVIRATPSHAESAVCFAARLSHSVPMFGAAGIVSGTFQHGDVGSRTQRFLTVMGPVVTRSWALCEAAANEGRVCLYAPPEETALPASVARHLAQHTILGAYPVL